MNKFFILVFLVYFSPYFISGSSASAIYSTFHNNLPEDRREEISIVDEYTVKVGLGPDQRSVSCTILDAVGSIPSINGKTEPEVVFVNKEKVNYISPGLYTWDRAGKYRVRLTTKYIREFGEITIRVPSKLELESTNGKNSNFTSIYYETLPEIKKQEITIIDRSMVEVGLSADLKTIRSDIQDAIKSIPMVTDDIWPEHVNVNGTPVFFIGNGLYSWDSEGSNPVKLTTPFIKKFGNIKVSISGKPFRKTDTAPSRATGAALKEKLEIAPAPPKSIEPKVSSSKAQGLRLKGFRLAHFGMDIPQVKKVIQEDFKIEEGRIKLSGEQKNLLTINTNKLSGDEATIHYYFSQDKKKLEKVNVLWEPSDATDRLALRLIQQFLSLRFLKSQRSKDSQPYLYYGKDSHGNEIKVSWVKNPKAPLSKHPLMLSYLGFTP